MTRSIFIKAIILGLFSIQAHAASIELTFDQDTTIANASGTTLTLIFANNTNNSATFSASDFISREWRDLNLFGPPNLTNNVGLFPESNLDNTTVTILGSVGITASPLDFGFSYRESDPSLGFDPFSFSRITGNRMRGPALWTAIDGVFVNFYLDSSSYDALGTPDNFTGNVPVPASIWLFGSALLGLSRIGKKTRAYESK